MCNVWADDIAIQGLSDLLEITISVLSTISESTILVSPPDGVVDPKRTVHVGLILENHYVGLNGSSETTTAVVNV